MSEATIQELYRSCAELQRERDEARRLARHFLRLWTRGTPQGAAEIGALLNAHGWLEEREEQ